MPITPAYAVAEPQEFTDSEETIFTADGEDGGITSLAITLTEGTLLVHIPGLLPDGEWARLDDGYAFGSPCIFTYAYRGIKQVKAKAAPGQTAVAYWYAIAR